MGFLTMGALNPKPALALNPKPPEALKPPKPQDSSQGFRVPQDSLGLQASIAGRLGSAVGSGEGDEGICSQGSRDDYPVNWAGIPQFYAQASTAADSIYLFSNEDTGSRKV